MFQKKIGLRPNLFVFMFFCFSMCGFGRGSKSNGAGEIRALGPSLRQRRFDVHVKCSDCVEERTRGSRKQCFLTVSLPASVSA